MRNKKMNKKGFTLVELLAVIVILALLIIITANAILPMMKKSRQSAMVVYAERVMSSAATSFQADSISGSTVNSQIYSIERLMGQDDYFGCVKITNTNNKYTYEINMYDSKNDLKIEGKSDDGKISKKAEDVAKDDTSEKKPADYREKDDETNTTCPSAKSTLTATEDLNLEESE